LKIISVVGARPQFIKAAPVSRLIRRKHREILLHTGQHYDENMSQIFFDDLGIPRPDYNLGVGSERHGAQTGQMLQGIEGVLLRQMPDWVLVYGDTNSTLAGALAAVKLHIKVAHVEAGLRSYNRSMPEEINRVLTDHCSDVLFCPTQTAVENLKREGIQRGVYLVGDVMYDAALEFGKLAEKKSPILERLNLKKRDYLLATVHRPRNTDNYSNLKAIVEIFAECNQKIVFPVHPRTRGYLEEFGLLERLQRAENVILSEPVGYLDMLLLEKNATKILTDSGGIQKEAYFFGVPCITLRDETEWVETVEEGWNIVVGTDKQRVLDAIENFNPTGDRSSPYGDGKASQKIVEILESDGP